MNHLLPPVRPLDHVVLPVADLDQARARHAALGFTVAPVGVHPFGTENACVYFADGTFLEPLAIGHRETADAAARGGNAFVARDQAYRFRCGEDGFSAAVFTGDDAETEQRYFQEEGLAGGRVVAFGRELVRPDGTKSFMEFQLAFAADLRAPDAFLFTCQRVNAPKGGKGALEHHANGVAGISAIVAVEDNPSDFQYLLQAASGQRDVSAHSFGIALDVPGARLQALTPAGYHALSGLDAPAGRGLRFVAVVFHAADLDALAALLARHRVAFDRRGGRIVVPPAAGQGAAYLFEARP